MKWGNAASKLFEGLISKLRACEIDSLIASSCLHKTEPLYSLSSTLTCTLRYRDAHIHMHMSYVATKLFSDTQFRLLNTV